MTQTQAINTFDIRIDYQSAMMRLLRIIGGSLFIALCAQIKIPLFFTPVPLTMQVFAIMLVGGFLGKKDGALAVITYLAEITAGLPFSISGVSTPLALLGPTGGYLIGFIFQAYCMGLIVEKKLTASPLKTFFVLCLVSTIQLLVGALWLGHFVGFKYMLATGFFPFVIGDYLKCLAATQIFAKGLR